MKIIFWLVLVAGTMGNARSQICLQFQPGGKYVLVGQPFEAKMKVNNVPKGATVLFKMFIEDSCIEVQKDTAKFTIKTEYAYTYVCRFVSEVKKKNKILFKDTIAYQFVSFDPQVAIESEYGNILYRGLENNLNIAAAGFRSQDLVINASEGLLRFQGNGRYSLQITKQSKSVTINVSAQLENGTMVNLGKKTFTVLTVPSPYCRLEKELVYLSPSDTAYRIIVDMPAGLPFLNGEVLAFDFEVKEGPKWNVFHAHGNSITGDLLEKVKKLPEGEMIYLKNIYWRFNTPGGQRDYKSNLVLMR